jgi:hypothetical protein
MRKLFWWSAGCVVAGVVAVSLAAHHISHYPDSWLGKCFIPAAREPARHQAGTAMAAAVESAVARLTQPGDQAMEINGKLRAQPMPEECAEAAPGPQFVEANEPIQVGGPGSPAGFNDSVPAEAGTPAAVVPGCPVPMPGGQEECEPAGPFMPPCPVCEPEDKLYMPPCPEDEDGKQMHLPYVGEGGDMKEEFELPTSVWFHWLLQKETPPKETKDRSEQLVPVTPGVAPETPEESEPAVPMNPPRCEEDPHYHHQYPGCPYMGGCPFGGPCTPEMKPQEAPTLKKDKKKKVQAMPMSFSRKLRTLLDGGLEVKECHTDEIKLDTMECRPSDLKLAGLDPHAPF